jgi:hypothetical protein
MALRDTKAIARRHRAELEKYRGAYAKEKAARESKTADLKKMTAFWLSVRLEREE